MALIGTMVFRPLTPVAATPLAMVPSQLLPIMPVLPSVQPALAVTAPVRVVYPRARPFSQSTTALADRTSERPPTSTQPSERLVAGEVDSDEGVAARDEVVVVEQRHLDDVAVRVVRLHLALVAAPAARVVGAGIHDDGDFAALPGGFAGADDVDGDPVGLSVAVAVEPGVDPDGLPDRVLVRVDRGALARGAVCGGGGEERGHQGGHGGRRERSPGREAHAAHGYRHARKVPRSTPLQKGGDERRVGWGVTCRPNGDRVTGVAVDMTGATGTQ